MSCHELVITFLLSEGTTLFVNAGPFANIAHDISLSILADRYSVKAGGRRGLCGHRGRFWGQHWHGEILQYQVQIQCMVSGQMLCIVHVN